MGFFGSSEEVTSDIKNDGVIQNVIAFDQQKHKISIESDIIVGLLAVLVLLKLIETFWFAYKTHRRGLKRRFAGTSNINLSRV
jgi:hypothetical protein